MFYASKFNSGEISHLLGQAVCVIYQKVCLSKSLYMGWEHKPNTHIYPMKFSMSCAVLYKGISIFSKWIHTNTGHTFLHFG